HGLDRPSFDHVFPQEFWREVVDRVAVEAPDTLLLAEAFWLMEGYFVRTLGMHRVYNSAFMNMLRDEKNQEYHLVVKNTLEFDPEILKRYVNFMNNPDERTAVDQFGKGDKYFGVCTLMVTMPGLPMFGHGQVEGYTEKYGMEFRRAYWDERPDGYLVERHEREIFPLLRRRYLFAEVKNFLLYDFYNTDGYVNEDVYAYSNRSGNERGLVVYHNKYAETRGWVRVSAATLVKSAADGKTLVQKTLGEGLELRNDPDYYAIFRDHNTGLEFIRNCRELHENGLYVELAAYQYQVFLDFREVQDNEWHQYAQLAGYLNGRGVPDINEALKEIFLQPIHRPFHELVNAGFFQWLIDNRSKEDKLPAKAARTAASATNSQEQALDEAEQKSLALLREVQRLALVQGSAGSSPQEIAAEIRSELAVILALPRLESRFPASGNRKLKAAIRLLQEGPTHEAGTAFKDRLASNDPAIWGVLFSWLFTHKLGKVLEASDYSEQSRSWIDEWLLGRILTACLKDLGLDEPTAQRSLAIIKLLIGHAAWCDHAVGEDSSAYQILQGWLTTAEIQGFLGVNRYQGVLWFNKESFRELTWWLFLLSTIEQTAPQAAAPAAETEMGSEAIIACYEVVQKLLEAEEQSGYQVDKLLEATK
ncbi:MAG TPA: alpha-amylase family protein, partial [Anaerolineales bacterium]